MFAVFGKPGNAVRYMPAGVCAAAPDHERWIWHREPRSLVAGAWIVALCLIGNVVAGCYVALAARGCRGNASRFWHGPHGAAEERA